MARSSVNLTDPLLESRGGPRLRTVVAKIGSAVIAPQGLIEPDRVRQLATDLASLRALGHRVVVVSSGAVASGFRSLGLDKPPKTLVDKQAAAAIGQPLLMKAWSEAFEACRGMQSAAGGRTATAVAQVLLTAEDVEHRGRFLNARRTLERLLESGIVPIINENDSVSFEEIKLGDNDRLSALVATLVSADVLILLSSVPGVLQGSGSHARVVPEIRTLEEGLALVRTDKTATGVGGMDTKIRAACAAAALGIETYIAQGSEGGVLARIMNAENVGTRFPALARRGASSSAGRPAVAQTTTAYPAAATLGSRTAARKKWLGLSARPRGRLIVDEGAHRAITRKGSSLLPSGLTGVVGEFDAGAPVEICAGSAKAEPFARGLACYPAADLRRICGLKTSHIQQVLGYHYSDEAVHRDDLVLLTPTDQESRG